MKFRIAAAKIDKYEKIYLIMITAFCCINQVLPFAIHGISNIITILLALMSVPILAVKVFGTTEDTFHAPVNTIGILLASAAFISLIINRFSGASKNIYGILSILINFLIIFDYFRKNGFDAVRQIVPVPVICLSALCLISDLLLFAHVAVMYDIGYHWIAFDPATYRFCGITGNPNSMAMVAYAGAVSSVLLLLTSKNKIVKISTVLSTILCLYTLFLTESRGMIFSFYFGLILTAFALVIFCSKSFFSHFKNVFLFLLAVVVVFGLCFAARNLIFEHVPDLSSDKQESAQVSEETDETANTNPIKKRDKDRELRANGFLTGRQIYWANGINATLSKHPVFGLTPGNAGNQILDYIEANDLPMTESYRYRVGDLHNHFVQSFAYYGLVGLILVLTLWIYFAKVFCKLICRKKLLGKHVVILSWCTFAIGSLLLHGMVEAHLLYTFDSSTVGYIFLIALGLSAYASNQIDPAILKDRVLDTLSGWIITLINLVKKPFCKLSDNGVSDS